MRLHKQLFIFPLFDFLIFIIFEMLFFFIFYYRFNIHIFDETTLEQWAIVSLWEFTLFTLVLIGPLYFLSFSLGFFSRLAISHFIMHISRNLPLSIFESIRLSLPHIKELIKYAWLKTLIMFTIETGIKRFLHKQIRYFGAAHVTPTPVLDYWYAQTVLIIPCIGFKNLALKEAIDCSTTLMESTFGEKITSQFHFTAISFIVTLLGGILLERIVTIYTNQVIGIAAFFAFFGFIFTFIRAAEGVFQASTYLFCTKQPPLPFSSQDFIQAFKPYEQR